MMGDSALFDRLVAEALAQPFEGWNFSYIADRWREAPTSWDYRAKARALMAGASSLLDMDTGGGEVLASLAPFPPLACATEGWDPNVPVARVRLEPLGVRVERVDSESDLPFSDAMFDLVLNRHGDYHPSELRRILKPGGRFLTQQVGGQNCIELNELLQDRVEFKYSYWTLDYALRELRDAGFEIVESRDEHPETIITDIGAVVYLLRIVSWQIADFSVEKYRHKLMALHNRIQEKGPLVIHAHRLYIEAQR